jgi:hypothetical protein
MSEKKVSGKVLMFTGIVIIVFLVAIFGFIFLGAGAGDDSR